MELKQIEIVRIFPSPLNPRKTFDEEAIKELSDNIAQQGLLQPITVRPKFVDFIDEGESVTTESYEIVCGERRYRAYMMGVSNGTIKSLTIPAIVREMDDNEALEAMLTENLQRKDVDPIEEATAFAKLSELGQSVKDLAIRFGKSERFIQDRIKLSSLIPAIQKMVSAGKVPMSGAVQLAKLKEEYQKKFADDYDDYNVSRFDIDRFVNNTMCSLSEANWTRSKWDETRPEGACKNCPCNTANASCLFYEMKEKTGRCTNKSCYYNKKLEYALHKITSHKNLLKKGEPLSFDKIAIVHCEYGGTSHTEETIALAERLNELGYEVYDSNKVFGDRIYYDADDSRVKDMLEKHEAYMCISIGDWSGIRIERVCYRPKKASADGANAPEVEILGKIKRAKEIDEEKTFDDLRNKFSDLSEYCSNNDALSSSEVEALFRIVSHEIGYGNPLRRDASSSEYKTGTSQEIYDKYAEKEKSRMLRAWLYTKLTDSQSRGPAHRKAIELVMTDKFKEEHDAIINEHTSKLNKRINNFNKRIEELKNK